MDKLSNSETGCCERFNPQPWDEKEVIFKDKLFLKERVISIFHIPLNFGAVMKRSMEKIQAAQALSDKPLMLSDENSLWGSDIYIQVSKNVPDSTMVRISGTFLSKAFEGSFSQMGLWIEEMKRFVVNKGKTIKKMYFYYTTCPACAKHYGKNYTVILAKV